MPDPDRLLRTLRQAVRAFRATAGRRGHLVCLEGVEEVFVAGDLHGNLDNFRQILQRAEPARHPRRHLVFQELVHGPFQYAGGGDRSHQLVDLVAALKCQYPAQVHLLLGNHELSQWTGRRIAKADLDLNDSFRQGVDTAYGARGGEVYETYLSLFAAVPVALRTPNRVFLSHSLPPAAQVRTFDPAALEREDFLEGDLLPGGAVHSLVWGRDCTAPTAQAFLQKIDADLLITGHIPCDDGFETPNDRQLILDCMKKPACACLFSTDRPLTHEELVRGVLFL